MHCGQVLGQSGAPKPENYEPYGQNSRPWRSFCNGTAVGGQKSKFETFRNFLISVMPGLFVRGCEKPRLERDRSQMVSHRPEGGDPRSYQRPVAFRRRTKRPKIKGPFWEVLVFDRAKGTSIKGEMGLSARKLGLKAVQTRKTSAILFLNHDQRI